MGSSQVLRLCVQLFAETRELLKAENSDINTVLPMDSDSGFCFLLWILKAHKTGAQEAEGNNFGAIAAHKWPIAMWAIFINSLRYFINSLSPSAGRATYESEHFCHMYS